MYGQDIVIRKEDCVNHVAKRLGTALRNKVKEFRIKKVTLGGKKTGGLTEATIKKLQNYFIWRVLTYIFMCYKITFLYDFYS